MNFFDKVKKMPILLISHGFQSSYEKSFANALAHHGLSITLIASARTDFQNLDSAVTPINLLPSMDPNRSFREKLCAKFCYVQALARQVRIHRHSIIHLTGLFLTSSIFFGIVELCLYHLFCRKLLVTVHNILPHDRESLLNFFWSWIAYRIPHNLIVHTDKMRDDLIQYWGINPNKIVVMEHGIDTIPITQTRRALGIAAELKLLMFGGIARYKGVDIALAALKLLDDFSVHLKIVGYCRDSQYESQLIDLINQIPPQHRVELHNEYVPEDDIQAIFEDADAVLLPYRHIDQSGVLFSSFRFGVPVIVFDVGSFARYVTPRVGIVISENSYEGLGAGIRAFRACAMNFDREVIKSYATQFQWKKTVKPVLHLYD